MLILSQLYQSQGYREPLKIYVRVKLVKEEYLPKVAHLIKQRLIEVR